MTEALTSTGYPPLVLHTRPAIEMDDEQFFEFCRLNSEWRIERTVEGDLEILPPAGGETGNRNAILTHLVTAWALGDSTGVAFDSSTGFILPNGATRAPDVAWVRRERLRTLTTEQKKRFLPLCPDFVAELRSPSDRLAAVQNKMQEYMDNGARLGWMIDVSDQSVYVYRAGVEVERLEKPSELSGEPELPGFALELRAIWEASF